MKLATTGEHVPHISHVHQTSEQLGSHYLVYQLDSNTKPWVTLNYRCLVFVHFN